MFVKYICNSKNVYYKSRVKQKKKGMRSYQTIKNYETNHID